MKRSPIKPGAKSLQRGSTFAARHFRVAGAPPRALSDILSDRERLRRRHRQATLAALKTKWKRSTRASVCAMCGSQVAVTGHHIIPLRVLKREGVNAALWFDTRNLLGLCMEPAPERCHQRHELHVRRVPRDVVLAGAPRALEFAVEVGLLHVFDREYPVQGGRHAPSS